ncbi:MAG: aminotransferase class IV [Bernardetiaceae bacterium]
MPPFIESIACRDGQAQLLPYHQARVRATFAAFFPEHPPLVLSHLLSHIPIPPTGTHKLRIIYAEQAVRWELLPYQLRPITSLRLVKADSISYAFKSEDRRAIQSLFQERGTADDILMIRDNYLTDSSYANVVCWRNGKGFTPHLPLLPGVQRAYLLEARQIEALPITVQSLLRDFEAVSLINAMIPLGGCTLPITAIKH